MEHSATVPVVVQLQVGAQPISGSLRVGDGAANEFRGWLQLTSLLEEAASGAGRGGSDQKSEREVSR